jgi:hypothetical protein
MSKILDLAPDQILVDPATQTALLAKAEKQKKEKQEEVDRIHKNNIAKWMKDLSRVDEFKRRNYNVLNPSNICIEVCTSYIKDDNPSKLIVDSSFNISANEEFSMRLFPYVKDLETGDIYTISDSFTMRRTNPAFAEWFQIASEKPSYKDEVPMPPRIIFLIDQGWDQNRFFMDKVKQVQSPNDFYTFVVSRSVLQTILKKVSASTQQPPYNQTSTY